ncbi:MULTISPECIES: molybdate ABC transporter substrate-binding protein [Methanobrevibacter]|uniref:Molybdate transport system substrate-binding protein n=1 Tax=Methanobrevibacter gottschalkii DSM 11977 TaxID=1122229 RepID=A0A3N5AYT3_9EURY|nr:MULTISPECIES: molybdate ABC transporter substrate-binding protein [Methanobrevibacter]OED01021.1 molybdate ABC transporter substrate-binding protein [Methanobrevibacter sp. A27]RPF50214.1 molybdate transport system substrate-binding protein [Methanobrevibacter gottschalkii DSM 11977]
MKSMKTVAVAIIAIVVIVAVGLYLTGSVGTSNGDLNGQDVQLAAAASLKNVYDEKLIPMFEEKYPGVKVTPTYASSGDLQKQIENGLKADVFMSAGNKQMDALINESYVDNDSNVKFLENKLVLIVSADSNVNVSSFEDLKNVNGTIAIGDPESVPAGQYANESLHNLGIWDDVESKLSLGTDVTAVLNQVAQGSADCGLVYTTDAKSSDEVKVICEAPEDSLKDIVYPVAPIKDSEHADAANKFMEFLQTPEAQSVFEDYGFTIHE